MFIKPLNRCGQAHVFACTFMLMVGLTSLGRPAQATTPRINPALSGAITSPASGPFLNFPTLAGTAHEGNGRLSSIKLLIFRRVEVAHLTFRLDSWNFGVWYKGPQFQGDGALSQFNKDLILKLANTLSLQFPVLPVTGTNANWSYKDGPTGKNFTKGIYYIAGVVFDRAGNAALMTPKAGGIYITGIVGTPPDITPPTGALTTPDSGSFSSFPTISGTAADSGGLDRVVIGIVRRQVGPTTTQIEYWNGTSFSTGVVVPNETFFSPTDVANFVGEHISALPHLPLTGNTATWSYAIKPPAVPPGDGTYYIAAAILDKAQNFSLLPGAPGYFRTITLGTATGVTISGQVVQPGSPTPTGVGNMPVYLLPSFNLRSVLAGSLIGLLRTTTLTSATALHPQGYFSFPNIAPNNSYYVLPVAPGYYCVPSFAQTVVHQGSPVTLPPFVLTGTDSVPPTVTIKTPVEGSSQANLAKATGGITDTGGSGVLKVFARLYTLNAIGDALPTGVWNWDTSTFSKVAGLNPSTLCIADFNKAAGTWSLTLPSLTAPPALPNGAYRLAVYGIDNAFNISAPVSQDFTIATAATVAKAAGVGVPVGLSKAEAQAQTGSVIIQFVHSLDAITVSNAANYAVIVNGQAVTLQSAGYDSHAGRLTLSLPDGVLQAGSSVAVSWSGLKTAEGTAVADGQLSLTAR